MKIMCLGHLTYDTTLLTNEYPVENEKYHLDKKIECGGGPAPNAGYLLGKWRENVFVAGIIGNDYQGMSIRDEFEKMKINTEYIDIGVDVQTDCSYIIANTENGSRTILTAKDSNHPEYSLDIDEEFDVLIFDGSEPDVAVKLLEANPNAISILDAGNLREGTMKIAPLVKYLVCSHDYAEDFTNLKINYDNKKSIDKVYKKMKETYDNTIIITLEGAGCYTEIDGKGEIIPSIEVEPVDSTGAGDIFHGAFAYFLIHDYDMRDVLKYANITGALSTLKVGSRFSMPNLDEVLGYGKDSTDETIDEEEVEVL
jgi:sulfofructose kinase